MSFQTTYSKLVARIDLEYILLFTMLISSGYMILESYNFGISDAATFPRLTAGFVLIGTLLLVFRSYLPEPLYSFVAESADLIDVDDGLPSEGDEAADDIDRSTDEDDEISTVDRPIHDSLFTSIAAVGYAILGYTIGILWASPIFILIYGLWFKLSWKVILVLIPLSLFIGFGFYEALGLRIDRGNIFLTEGVL